MPKISIKHTCVLTAIFLVCVMIRMYYHQVQNPNALYEGPADKCLFYNIPEENNNANNNSYDRLISERFARRYLHMYKDCPTKEPRGFVASRDIYVNINHGIEVCVTGKSGSSSWHKLVWQLRQFDNGLSYNPCHYTINDTIFNHHTSQIARNHKLLHNWTHGIDDDFFTEPNPQIMHRVFMGRHPFARLISGWNQKTRRRTDGNEMHFLDLNPRMKEFKDVEPDDEHIMSWEDWAHYISVHRKNGWKTDYHFTVATESCRPCSYFFTYIVKMESLTEDRAWLMKRLNLTGDIQLGHAGSRDESKTFYNPGASIQKYMKRLSPKVVQDLYDLYKPDFERFGYTFNFDTYMAGGFD